MTKLNNGLIVEIKQCYKSTKDWKKQEHNQQYYHGLCDAYVHLIRFTDQTKGVV